MPGQRAFLQHCLMDAKKNLKVSSRLKSCRVKPTDFRTTSCEELCTNFRPLNGGGGWHNTKRCFFVPNLGIWTWGSHYTRDALYTWSCGSIFAPKATTYLARTAAVHILCPDCVGDWRQSWPPAQQTGDWLDCDESLTRCRDPLDQRTTEKQRE